MNIGEKIRQLRTDKNLTQPQLAEAIGIEQSYLSKLENDKSVPSAEIFQSILRALSIDVAAFLAGIDEKIVHRQLRQIPEVANHLNASMIERIHDIRCWLYASAAACAVGLSLIVAGYKGLIFSNARYDYVSAGVIRAGEPSDIFDNFQQWLGSRIRAGEITEEQASRQIVEFKNRIDAQHVLLNEYRGESFVESVEGGHRIYTFRNPSFYERPQNRWLMLAGTVLTFAGLSGFFIEYRLRSVRTGTVA